MKTPRTSHETNQPRKTFRNSNTLLQTPVQAQRRPDSVVNKALAPRANLQAERLILLRLDFLARLDLAGGFALGRDPSFPEDVLPPEHEELEEDVSEPAPSAPDVPFIDSAVFFHKSLW